MDNGDTRTAVDAGILIGEPKRVGDAGAFAVIPHDAKLVDLEQFLPVPGYAKSAVTARTVDSLVAYVNRHRTDNTSVFADVESGRIKAVVDYLSKANEPAHRAHSVTYSAPFSEEWATWTGIDGKKMAQADFARFIEENRDDIITPDGATVLEIARTLDARKKVSFKSGIRLEDGTVDLAYSEETTHATGGITGKVSIPSEIIIGIPVFYGGDRYKITAFLRYRIEEGRLVMWVDLHRKKHIRDAAFSDIVDKVTECEGVPVYEGTV